MKAFILFSFLLNFLICNSQTIEKEEANINRIIAQQVKSPEEIKTLVDNWRSFVKEFGDFPQIPLNDQTDLIEYSFTKTHNLTKQIILQRILEWSAINFGSLNSVLHYQDEASGKIILKGFFSIAYKEDYINFWGNKKEAKNTTDCYQTYIFTVKDNKLKIELCDLKVEYHSESYLSGNTYIPEKVLKVPLYTLYPITNYKPIEWKENLDVLKQVDKKINLLIADLEDYINNYNQDYSF